MDQYKGENRILLRGQAAGQPVRSHQNHGVEYYIVPLRVPRLSGVDDVLNIVTADPDPAVWAAGNWVSVQGEVRSYNNRSGQGSKLVITVLARSAQRETAEEGEIRGTQTTFWGRVAQMFRDFWSAITGIFQK